MAENARRKLGRRTLIGLAGLVTALALASCSMLYGGGPGGSPVQTDSVAIRGMAFQPANIEVQVGTTVTWTNHDGTTHTVTSDTAAFNSGSLADGASFSFTFAQTGTFPYHCSIHPGMRGSVLVTP